MITQGQWFALMVLMIVNIGLFLWLSRYLYGLAQDFVALANRFKELRDRLDQPRKQQ